MDRATCRAKLDELEMRTELLCRSVGVTPPADEREIRWLKFSPWRALADAGIETLADLAARPREEVAAIRGVGPATMGLLDAALSVEGLSYAEAV
jgi:hypothetical protein